MSRPLRTAAAASSYASCQRCGKPGRPENYDGRVRRLGVCYVCGYGAADPLAPRVSAGEASEERLRKNGFASGDLFAAERLP